MKNKLCVLLIIIISLVSLTACSDEIKEEKVMNNEITAEQSSALLAKDDSLPIGTVISLKDFERKVMIIGVLQFNGSDQSVLYDYSGVVYPEGLIDPKNNYLFNKDQIERVYYLGYHNEEQDALQQTIKQARDNYNAQQQ